MVFLTALMFDVLNTQKGFDVFNALDLMENKTFLEKLKFGIGDVNLQYYLYNWKCPSMGSDKVILSLIRHDLILIDVVSSTVDYSWMI